jgi:heavy metal efflux system protein
MQVAGIALTVMSIGGLAIGIGKVANGSIIMVENIYRVMHEKRGRAPLALTAEAAKDVGGYLASANLIIILVFLPLLTLGGIEGAMFKPTAFAVAAALLGSLVLNLSLQPVLASYLLAEKHVTVRDNPVSDFLSRHYRRLLARCPREQGRGRRRLRRAARCCRRLLHASGKGVRAPARRRRNPASTVMAPRPRSRSRSRWRARVERIMLSFSEVAAVARTTGAPRPPSTFIRSTTATTTSSWCRGSCGSALRRIDGRPPRGGSTSCRGSVTYSNSLSPTSWARC